MLTKDTFDDPQDIALLEDALEVAQDHYVSRARKHAFGEIPNRTNEEQYAAAVACYDRAHMMGQLLKKLNKQ